MKTWNRRRLCRGACGVELSFWARRSSGDRLSRTKPLKEGSQADASKLAKQDKVVIAYMPPATEFNYYMAIGEGIKAAAAASPGVETFMLAPQSGADINGQMGMIQDVITEGVSAIILSTHDEAAAAPLVKKAVDKGIAVIIVNSDIANFPTPVHGVVGYSQRAGTQKLGDYFLGKLNGARSQGRRHRRPARLPFDGAGRRLPRCGEGQAGHRDQSSVPGRLECRRRQHGGHGPSAGQSRRRHRVRGQRLHDHGRRAGGQVARPAAQAARQRRRHGRPRADRRRHV